MLETLLLLKSRVQSLLQEETGVVAWEYLLVIAGVSVAIIVAVSLAPPVLSSAVINATCSAMHTILPTPAVCTF